MKKKKNGKRETYLKTHMLICNGKKGYRSKFDAEIVLTYASGAQARCRGSSKQGPCRVYLCPLCNTWHLTSQP